MSIGPERIDRIRRMATRVAAIGQNLEDFRRLDVPILAKHAGQFAVVSQKMGGEFLVRRQIGKRHVLDRMAEGPMSQVVQQGRRQHDLGPVRVDDLAKAGVLAELQQVPHGVVKHAQRMLEPRVRCPRINAGGQAQLGDVLEPLKFARVDQGPHAAREGNVLFDGNPHQPAPGLEAGQFRNVQERWVHGRHSS